MSKDKFNRMNINNKKEKYNSDNKLIDTNKHINEYSEDNNDDNETNNNETNNNNETIDCEENNRTNNEENRSKQNNQPYEEPTLHSSVSKTRSGLVYGDFVNIAMSIPSKQQELFIVQETDTFKESWFCEDVSKCEK
jgi:hypothetical protein